MLVSRSEAEDNLRLSIAPLVCVGSPFETRMTRKMDISHFKTLVTRFTRFPEETLALPYTWVQFDLYLKWISQTLDYHPIIKPLLKMAIELDDDRLMTIIEKYDLYETSLNLAAKKGQLSVVKDLCQQREYEYDRGFIKNLHGLIFHAVQAREIEVLDFLLDSGGIKEIYDKVDLSAVLAIAAHRGRVEAVKLLCQRLDPVFNARSLDLQEIFQEAVYSANLELLDFLIEYFLLEEKWDQINPVSALTSALIANNLELVEFLIERFMITRVDLQRENFDPLYQVCRLGSWPMVQYLFERFGLTRADLETNNYRALRKAAKHNLWSIVEFLVHRFRITVTEVKNPHESLKERLFPEINFSSPSTNSNLLEGVVPPRLKNS